MLVSEARASHRVEALDERAECRGRRVQEERAACSVQRAAGRRELVSYNEGNSNTNRWIKTNPICRNMSNLLPDQCTA